MKLAWRNLCHDQIRFAVTVAGISFATFLMIFQGSLLAGFIAAASKMIEASDADIWVTPRGTTCFDFSSPLPARFRELALGVEGVGGVRRLASNFAYWKRPSGVRQTVLLIAADAGGGRAFPLPYLNDGASATKPDAVLVDSSNLETLGIASFPTGVEINGLRAVVEKKIEGFGSFMGSPYVFTGYREGAKYLGLTPEETMYLLVDVAPGRDVQEVQRRLAARLPEADVWTREEFSRKAELYWIIQTGAGGALLTAALLGFVVGVVVVSQTIYATTMENIEEFATLKAMGASGWYVKKIVLTQSLTSGVFGSAVGVALTYPAVRLARESISWVYTPWWLPASMIGVSLVMCALAAVVSIRKAVSVEPGRVFRA
jgi:putative ABC transport system permease protein